MIPFLIPLLFLIKAVKAQGGWHPTTKDSTFYSCIAATNELKFDFTVPTTAITSEYWYPLCNHDPIIGTILVCFNDNLDISKDFEREKLLKYTYNKYIDSCERSGDMKFDNGLQDLKLKYENATQNLILSPPSQSNNTLYYNPVKVSSSYVKKYETSYTHFIGNLVHSLQYVNLVCLYWVVVFVCCFLSNKFPLVKTNKVVSKLRGFITLPTFLKRHNEPWNLFTSQTNKPYWKIFDTLLPTFQETVILITYLIFIILISTSDYDLETSSLLLGSTKQQHTRFIADRTGLLAFAQLPPLFLFGGRNNILIKFTGLPFSSFIALHKWIGRLMVGLAYVHAVYFFNFFYFNGSLETLEALDLWKFGVQAFHCGAILLLQGIFYLRRKWYEAFLVIHIGFALLFLYSAYMHCKDIGFLNWVIASGVVWFIDRVWRVYTMLKFCGFGVGVKANFKLVNDCVRVSIPRPEHFNCFPGCYVHFYVFDFGLNWRIWENHPFTIFANDDEIRIYIKSKEGFTGKLHSLLESTPGNELDMKVCLEGPYGHHVDINSYDKVILISGGNGIPGPYYHLTNSLRKTNAERLPQIDFIWISQTRKTLGWFQQELKELVELDQNNQVNKLLYLTREKQQSDSETTPMISGDENSYSMVALDNGTVEPQVQYEDELSCDYQVISKRPDIRKLVANKVTDGDKTVVLTCGSGVLVDMIRDSVAVEVSHGVGNAGYVDYIEELQVWS